jgi:hypothetical protein
MKLKKLMFSEKRDVPAAAVESGFYLNLFCGKNPDSKAPRELFCTFPFSPNPLFELFYIK